MVVDTTAMSSEQLLALVASLQADVTAARQAAEDAKAEAEKARREAEEPIQFSVGQKGGIYVKGGGLGRGITLYQESVPKLAAAMPRLADFVARNRDRLKTRDEDHAQYWARIGKSETEIADLVKAQLDEKEKARLARKK